MFRTRDLKQWISRNIHTAEDLLATMMTTTQNPFTRCYLSPSQITLHVGYLKMMSGLTYKVGRGSDLLDINHAGTAHINDTELKYYGSSMIAIGYRVSETYKYLCTRKTSIASATLGLLYALEYLTANDHAKSGSIPAEQTPAPSPHTPRISAEYPKLAGIVGVWELDCA